MNNPASEAETIWRPEVIPGQQVFLSHIRREDIPLFARWFSDLEFTTYTGAIGMSSTLEQEEEWFASITKDPTIKYFGIVVCEGQQLIGNISLKQINYRHGTAEIGIGIGEKSTWGKGYGSEAIRLMVDYGFTFLGLHSICLWHTSFNERGHRAYLKAGFKVAGQWREAALFDGQRYDHVLMDITREDFGPSQLRSMLQQLQDK
ncbi:MAG: Protein N-acetyltransferase, RimJ/RimL family [Chloroflexi bacterium AL-W]|nr:Protein N-acetyltransferase, RimJ/RimL family [Chloroflexi bacterium AL-N1]NOK70476.1 Protein N-acetyltransferase, RimJ/RimL family [Chloroflexi bacterium AL-N10]NOK78165.1 Protein N-acetyltransferase, RimJ/RimL family [Chloroflexi bacterium AL-N5]NOK85264.1 Protein N-acetyltransferase, RimJ/RimL family [Chloroflexi bacterium AL-W]NOK92029.1 Protein N-acetyltransferase, RimJ/RimL family [Chloroflexi bacterium AL-N15]